MKKFLVAVFIFAIIILTTIFLLYQYHAFAEPALVTEKVIYDTIYQDINGMAYSLRTETVLNQEIGGVLNFAVDNGQKVSKGEVIAHVYGSEQDVYLSSKVKKLQDKIGKLEYYQKSNGASIDIKSIESAIDKVLVDFTHYSTLGEVANAAAEKEELELLQCQRRLLLGEVDSLQPQIDELSVQLSEASAGISQSIENITTPVSGYIVQGLDNLEDKLSIQQVYTMTASQFKEVAAQIQQLPKGSALGVKVLEGFEVDLASVVSDKSVSDITIGQSVTLKFPFALDETISATVKYISDEAGAERLLILNCKILHLELLTQREHSIQIIKKSYSGLRINNNAIRINEDGVTGVYVVIGNIAMFKPVDIVYSDQYYSIAKVNNDSDGALLLYDEVIVKGKELYNGKIVR